MKLCKDCANVDLQGSDARCRLFVDPVFGEPTKCQYQRQDDSSQDRIYAQCKTAAIHFRPKSDDWAAV